MVPEIVEEAKTMIEVKIKTVRDHFRKIVQRVIRGYCDDPVGLASDPAVPIALGKERSRVKLHSDFWKVLGPLAASGDFYVLMRGEDLVRRSQEATVRLEAEMGTQSRLRFLEAYASGGS